MEKRDHISQLFAAYLSGKHSTSELNELLSYFDLDRDEELLSSLIKEEMEKSVDSVEQEELIAVIESRLEKKLFSKTRSKFRLIKLLPWISAAAVVLVGLFFLFYFIKPPGSKLPVAGKAELLSDVAPGGNMATLTLSNGNRIDLGSAKTGQLALQDGTKVTKTSAGQIVYSSIEASKINSGFNKIQTPKGGEYHVILPDGTEVWLNAASSLKYPVSFSAQTDRKVELQGEAYFQVAHNRAKPFKVISSGQTVEVLGTHFNVMAYADESSMKTTLLEGAVKVFTSKREGTVKQSKILRPGQQAITNSAIEVVDADIELAMAWKNGRTYFKDADIPTMMRALSKWYNIEIEYRGAIPEKLFTGGISRRSNLSVMLKILELAGIHTVLEGRKLIITP